MICMWLIDFFSSKTPQRFDGGVSGIFTVCKRCFPDYRGSSYSTSVKPDAGYDFCLFLSVETFVASQLLPCMPPNASAGVTCKLNLKASFISNTPLTINFLEQTFAVQTCSKCSINCGFCWGMIKFKLSGNTLNDEFISSVKVAKAII